MTATAGWDAADAVYEVEQNKFSNKGQSLQPFV
jgi:hypothetical protein